MNGRKASCSIRDLARYMGLSTCTVSKVLNNRSDFKIQEETRQRVLEAARTLNYVPNVNAQRLFRRRSGVIGLLVPAHPLTPGNVFGDSHFVDILSGMEPRLEESDYHLMLLFRNEEKRPDESYQRLFRAGTIDGLLIWGAHRSDRCYEELIAYGAPHLFITSFPHRDSDEAISFVAADYRENSEQMTRDLIADGARSILYLAGPEENSVVELMTAGIEAGIRGTAATLFTTHGLFSQNDTYRQVLRQAASREFDSIISASALMAIGASHALRELGMAPESKRWVLLDSASRTEVLPYPHRRALMNDQRIGSEAISGLIDLIEGRCARVRKIVPISIC